MALNKIDIYINKIDYYYLFERRIFFYRETRNSFPFRLILLWKLWSIQNIILYYIFFSLSMTMCPILLHQQYMLMLHQWCIKYIHLNTLSISICFVSSSFFFCSVHFFSILSCSREKYFRVVWKTNISDEHM